MEDLSKILIVDDEEGVLEMVRTHFELRGFSVLTAIDGKEAVTVCEKIRPRVVLLDLKMKQMDGDQALPILKKLAPEAKFFIVSACQSDEIESRVKGLGADGYFEKPVSILRVEQAVRAALGMGI